MLYIFFRCCLFIFPFTANILCIASSILFYFEKVLFYFKIPCLIIFIKKKSFRNIPYKIVYVTIKLEFLKISPELMRCCCLMLERLFLLTTFACD